MKSTGPDAATRELVMSRDNGRCLRCAVRAGEQIHHRKPRGMGGTKDPKINAPENLVWICLSCHEHIERNRATSYASGWLVARNANPAEQYLITPNHVMLMLLTDGGMEANELPDNYDEVPW